MKDLQNRNNKEKIPAISSIPHGTSILKYEEGYPSCHLMGPFHTDGVSCHLNCFAQTGSNLLCHLNCFLKISDLVGHHCLFDIQTLHHLEGHIWPPPLSVYDAYHQLLNISITQMRQYFVFYIIYFTFTKILDKSHGLSLGFISQKPSLHITNFIWMFPPILNGHCMSCHIVVVVYHSCCLWSQEEWVCFINSSKRCVFLSKYYGIQRLILLFTIYIHKSTCLPPPTFDIIKRAAPFC